MASNVNLKEKKTPKKKKAGGGSVNGSENGNGNGRAENGGGSGSYSRSGSVAGRSDAGFRNNERNDSKSPMKKKKNSNTSAKPTDLRPSGSTLTPGILKLNSDSSAAIISVINVKKNEKLERNSSKAKKALEQTKNNSEVTSAKSGNYFSKGDIALLTSHAQEAAQALNLQQWHLQRLKRQFDFIDVDRSGSVDRSEFMQSVGEQRSPFTDRLFDLIDLDGSGSVDFEEYVRVMATYCMYTKDEIMRFCFDCFDADGSGTIDEQEFIQLCKIINNAAPSFPNNFKNALQSFDTNSDGLIDYNEFLEIERRFPIMLFPAFRLQDAMQRNSLGEQAWLRINEYHTKKVRIDEYQKSHGGRLPPDPILITIAKLIAPCMFSTPQSRDSKFAAVGTAIESRKKL